MSGPHDLSSWVASARATDLLPARHGGEAATIVGPFALLDALPLGHGAELAIVADAGGREYPTPVVAAGGRWRRALPGDGASAAVTRLVTGRLPVRGRFEALRWAEDDLGSGQGERAVDVDQTNESVVVSERVIVKWCVRATTGTEPGPARLAALMAAGFTDMPRPWGVLRWRRPTGADVLVATVAEYLPDARDGWEWAVEDVRALARGDLSPRGAVTPAAVAGEITARMHLGLPERGPASRTLVEHWRAAAEAELDEAVAVVDGPEGQRLRGSEPRLRATLSTLDGAAGTPLSDVHGDLHVGQLLRWGSAGNHRYAVTDFDGNPVLPAAERAAPAPLAADVAGLVQAFDHVGRVVLFRTEGVDAAVVEEWIATAKAAVLESYRRALAGAGAGHRFDATLLPALRARQVVREYLYAARHLPHWRYVPDTALPALPLVSQA